MRMRAKQLSNRKSHDSIGRLIDANLNRLREGLRVVEDTFRFIGNDDKITQQFRKLRHKVTYVTSNLPPNIFSGVHSRNVAKDVGPALEEKELRYRQDVKHIIRANLKRSQESARVIEEYLKLCHRDTPFRQIRYRLYDLEKKVLEHPLVLNMSNRVHSDLVKTFIRDESGGLYGIIDYQYLRSAKRDCRVAVEQVVCGGCRLIQFRAKGLDKRTLVRLAKEICLIVHKEGGKMIINDWPEIALKCDADGVHLGCDDCSISKARRILGQGRIIGRTCRDLEQGRKAINEGSDYLSFGPVFPTRTKKIEISPIGTKVLAKARDAFDIPVVAIGGINVRNLTGVFQNGADAVAMISGILDAPKIEQRVKKVLGKIKSIRDGM